VKTSGISLFAFITAIERLPFRGVDELRLQADRDLRETLQVLAHAAARQALVGDVLALDPAEPAHLVEEGLERGLVVVGVAGEKDHDQCRLALVGGGLLGKREARQRRGGGENAEQSPAAGHGRTVGKPAWRVNAFSAARRSSGRRCRNPRSCAGRGSPRAPRCGARGYKGDPQKVGARKLK
jgi:hypothetical protein